MKKVIKNLPKRKYLERFEKKLDVMVTYYDGKTGEMHFTEKKSGKKWRSLKGNMEFICSLMDGVERCYISIDEHEFCFVPEGYKA